jgi:hypothetical protein
MTAGAALRGLAARVPATRALSDFVGRYRYPPVLQHPVGRRRPQLAGAIVPERAASAADVAIAERLLAAYHAAVGSSEPQAEERPDVWTEIRERQGQFEAILERRDPTELAGYLCNVSRHDAMHGISQGDVEFERIGRDRHYREFLTLVTQDKLVSLAEAVGALPVENPEQGAYGASLHNEPATLVAGIEARLGLDITPPDVDGGLLKLRAGDRLFSERDLSALYTAQLLARATRSTPAPRTCEIGGGAGRLAYWAHRLGLTAYTIVDLPRVNVVQGYYLLKTLPADRVLLYGEDGADDLYDGLRVLPTHAISSDRAHEYDLVVNQDSFPEMDAVTVREYLTWIRSCCRGQLMSVNQENKPAYGDGMAHVSVPETIDELGGFRLVQRFPYWLRAGYVMELYELDG